MACEWPMIPLPFGLNLWGGNCIQPILWHKQELKESLLVKGEYKASPPEPKTKGHWTGYYIEVFFEGDTVSPSRLLRNDFSFSTPGYTWPNTLSFKDCDGMKEECKTIIV